MSREAPVSSTSSPAAASSRPLHPGFIILGMLLFVAAVSGAARSGIWLAHEYVPDGAATAGPVLFKTGDELTLAVRDNFYIAGEDAKELRSFIFQRTARPNLTLRESSLGLIYLDGGERLRVIRYEADVVLVEILEGRFAGRHYFIEKKQMEELAP